MSDVKDLAPTAQPDAPPAPAPSESTPPDAPGPEASAGGVVAVREPAAAAPAPATAVAPAGPSGPFFGPQWPGPGGEAPQPVLLAALVAGVVAAAALPWDGVGVGWFVTALAAALAIAGTVAAFRPQARPTSNSDIIVRLAWGVATLALMAVGGIRAAGWLFALCLPTAVVTGALAVAGGRTLRGLFLGVMAVPIATIRALPWGWRTTNTVRGRAQGNTMRTAAAAAVGLVLLFIFGALLAGADAAFAKLVDGILPAVNAGAVVRWVFSFLVVGLGTLAACFLALAPPSFDSDEPSRRRTLRRIEWALPVGALVLLFTAFVAIQATVLFGGKDYVLRTANLTAADYAREGFGQLVAVTILTLAVLAIAARFASRETVEDRIWLRAMLGALSAMTLVIVASALSRMWAYEQAYGFTEQRLLVSVFEIWLGVVFVLVLVAGIRLRARATWLPTAILGAAVLALLGLAALNPDRYIADRNVDRFARTGWIDLYYLENLSADAVPALNRLPEGYRVCVLHEYDEELDDAAAREEWRHWNLGRAQARWALADYVYPYENRLGPNGCTTLDWDTNP